MIADQLQQPLVKTKTYTFEIIQSLLFMVAYSTGLGILGSTYTLKKFHIDSLLTDFLIMTLVLITYTLSHHTIAYCCRESSEKFNFAEYLEDHFGKVTALLYDVLMTLHNIILLAYIQFFIAHFMVDTTSQERHGDRAYYFLAIVNIPLIFISLSSEFKRIRWLCIALLVCWVYVFIGRVVEISSVCSGEEYWDELSIASSQGFGSWVIKLVGLQLYFASAFQSLPFIYKEAKKEAVIGKVINYSAGCVLVVYFTVYLFYTLDPESGLGKSCKDGVRYTNLTDYGRVLAGACAIVINVIPARFAFAQLLSGNDAATLQKASSSDKLLSALLIMLSIVLSLFMFNDTFWRLTICLGVILSSILGVLVPAIALMFSKEYSRIVWPNWVREVKTENRNKKHFVLLTESSRKVFIFGYLTWACVFSIFGVVSGLFIMTDP